MQALARARETSRIGDSKKVAKMTKFHCNIGL
jgi:hypothetical protein